MFSFDLRMSRGEEVPHTHQVHLAPFLADKKEPRMAARTGWSGPGRWLAKRKQQKTVDSCTPLRMFVIRVNLRSQNLAHVLKHP